MATIDSKDGSDMEEQDQHESESESEPEQRKLSTNKTSRSRSRSRHQASPVPRRVRSPRPPRSSQPSKRGRSRSPREPSPSFRRHHRRPLMHARRPVSPRRNNHALALAPPRLQPQPTPLRFARGQLVVVQLPSKHSRLEAPWKNIFRGEHFQIYDNKYPFRIAAETVLHQNKGYRQGSRFRNMRTEPYTDFLYQQSSSFFGKTFETDYFVDWYEHLPVSEQRKPIVVFGVGETEGARRLLSHLKDIGALVVSPPQSGGDYIMHSILDLQQFVKRL